MATAPSRQAQHAKKRRRPEEDFGGVSTSKAAQLIIDLKYANELPKPPVPKLLKALPAIDRLCRYAPSSLELDHRPFLLSEKDPMSFIELVDQDAYGDLPAEGSMAPPAQKLDAQLLRDDDVSAKQREVEGKRRKLFEQTEAFHREAFGLQLPQLVTNDVFTERQRFITGLEAAEKKIFREPPGFKSSEDLVARIDKTFELAKASPVHPSKPEMKPKRIMSIVPDAVLWANRYRQIIFDELPREPSRNDLLFKTIPTPRATCFGYFSSQGDGTGQDTYRLAQNYFWDNRGGFTRSSAIGEGEAILLSLPPEGEPEGEARFVLVPGLMRLKKQKAHRLDINLETQALTIKHVEPSIQEAAEEQERMHAVLSDEHRRDDDEVSFDYIDGEWQIRGDPRSHLSSSREPTTPNTHKALTNAPGSPSVGAGASPR